MFSTRSVARDEGVCFCSWPDRRPQTPQLPEHSRRLLTQRTLLLASSALTRCGSSLLDKPSRQHYCVAHGVFSNFVHRRRFTAVKNHRQFGSNDRSVFEPALSSSLLNLAHVLRQDGRTLAREPHL